MKDTPGTRIETELDRIRREAFEKEARALKEAALQHFKDQTLASLEGLKSAVRDEMTAAVRQAMAEQGVKEALRKELTDQVGKVAATLTKQIEERIEKEVAKEIKKSETWLGEKFASFAKAYRNARTDDVDVKEKPKHSGDQDDVPAQLETTVDHSKVPTAAASGKKPLWKRFFSNDWAVGTIFLSIFLAAVFVIFRLLKPDPESNKPLDTSTRVVARTTTTSDQPGAHSTSATQLRAAWMEAVTAAENRLVSGSALEGLLVKHQFNEQFSCWFSKDAQKELEKLARASSPDDVQDKLEGVFESCFTAKPPLRDPMLAVFSAQATVTKTFSKHRNEWESWCAIANETSPPTITADGFSGPSTFEAMNVFLKCTGHSSELTMEAASTTPQYLYITYLALQELQP